MEMLFYEDLTPQQIDMLREIFFEDIADESQYTSKDEITNAILEQHYRHEIFYVDDFLPNGRYYGKES